MKKKIIDVDAFRGGACFALVLACMLHVYFAAGAVYGTDRMVTPVTQTESENGTRLSAPVNARPPEDIDADDLKPTLFAPLIKMMTAIQKSQKDALERLDLLAASGAVDRTDEVLEAVKGINERQVTIKGWEDNKRALEALTDVFDKFRERFESLATVEDVQNAVALIEIPEPEPVELPDLSPFAKEETLLMLGDNLPTVANVREISANVASLTARLDEIAAQVEELDISGDAATLKKQLQFLICAFVVLALIVSAWLCVAAVRWIISMTQASKAKRERAELERFKRWKALEEGKSEDA